MTVSSLVIFGTAEIATLARFYFEQDTGYKVRAFTVDDEFVKEPTLEGLPVVPFSEVAKEFPTSENCMHVGLSYNKLNQLREEKFNQCRNAGYRLASYICTRSVTWPDLKHGENCFVLENQTIQPGVTLGDNVMLWSGNHIGHGSSIGNHTYFASHVVLSGHCKIGKRCFFGVNATVKDFTEIGDDCFITMDASVTRNLPDGCVAMGAEGTIMLADDRRARAIKKAYFKL